jgi:hypothetical protein
MSSRVFHTIIIFLLVLMIFVVVGFWLPWEGDPTYPHSLNER